MPLDLKQETKAQMRVHICEMLSLSGKQLTKFKDILNLEAYCSVLIKSD